MRALLLLLLPACEVLFPLDDPGATPDDALPPGDISPPRDVSPLDQGLIVQLSFDDPRGITFDPFNQVACATDSCPASVEDRHRMPGAAAFSGQCLVVPHDAAHDPPELTIALWVRIPISPAMLRATLLARALSDNATQTSFEVAFDGTSMVLPRIMGTGLDPAVDQAWHHIAITSDGSAAVTYLDGDPIGPVISKPIAYQAVPITIGCRRTTSGDIEHFLGELDDVRIYNRRLSNAEISALGTF